MCPIFMVKIFLLSYTMMEIWAVYKVPQVDIEVSLT
jgi:hypothetical protein